jgi:hypothetical protein
LTKKVSYYTLDEMLLSCTFNSLACDASFFTMVVNMRYGPCYFFNSNQNRSLRSEKPGRDFGLSLELYVGTPSQQPPWFPTNGLVVAVANKTTRPVFTEEGIKIKGGQEINLMLTKQEFHKLPKPFSECIEDVTSISSYNSDEYKMTFNYTKNYRQKLCVQRCAVEPLFSQGILRK